MKHTAAGIPWPPSPRSAAEEFEILSSGLSAADSQPQASLPQSGIDLKKHLATVEQDMIRRALQDADGVVQRAAEILGVGRTTLVEKLGKYNSDMLTGYGMD